MKHTFGRRLRAAGVSFEDRRDLLEHCSARITARSSVRDGRAVWQHVPRATHVGCIDAARAQTIRTLSLTPCSGRFSRLNELSKIL